MNNKFLQNKYAKWYFNIIKHRCQNIPKGYVEQHHVLPKSIGGDECDSNLVMLTAKEHYICHLLLIKAIASKEDRHKMYCAAFLMGYRIKEARKGKIPACLYEKIKQEMIENMAVKKRGKTFEEIYGKEKVANFESVRVYKIPEKIIQCMGEQAGLVIKTLCMVGIILMKQKRNLVRNVKESQT